MCVCVCVCVCLPAHAGLTLGPVDAQNIAALAALHLISSLDAAALTGERGGAAEGGGSLKQQ
jgi:hypothetical protein